MDSRNSKEQLKKDIEFLDEMNEAAEKWRDGNDWSSRDLLFELIKDWKSELNERIKLCE
jgi:hypothetical protein